MYVGKVEIYVKCDNMATWEGQVKISVDKRALYADGNGFTLNADKSTGVLYSETRDPGGRRQ